jgi:hypothetical protein
MMKLTSGGRRGAAAARRVAGTRVQLRAASGSRDSKDALVLRESVRCGQLEGRGGVDAG